MDALDAGATIVPLPTHTIGAIRPQNLNLSEITSVDKLLFLKRIAADRRLNATDLRCAIVIADYFNRGKGRAWPSYTRLAGDTGASRASVARSIRKLDELRLIHRIGGHKGRSNSYVPDFVAPEARREALEATSHPSQPQDDPSLSSETTSVSPVRPNPTITPRSIQRRGSNSNPTGLGASAGAAAPARGAPNKTNGVVASSHGQPYGFEEFWDAYPKKEGRVRALVEFRSAVSRGATPATLVAKAKQYAGAKARVSDPRYLKMPSNWLRDECWREDPQAPKPKLSREAKSSGPVRGKKSVGKRRRKVVKRPEPRRAEIYSGRGATLTARHQAELARQREAEAARLREAVAVRQRQAELVRQREAEAARLREAEAAREREADLARQREAELARQREAARTTKDQSYYATHIVRLEEELEGIHDGMRKAFADAKASGIDQMLLGEIRRRGTPRKLRSFVRTVTRPVDHSAEDDLSAVAGFKRHQPRDFDGGVPDLAA
jgi:hypothetical protein